MAELSETAEIEDPETSEGITAADWLDAASQEPDELEVDEYDIISAPNDWNVSTIVNFIESGAVKIPPFQRNYVWDIKRASKLIESLLLGLPVPQVFLFEEARNSFLVIDGQQRLLSLFFFCKGRFPKPGSRAAVRTLLGSGAGKGLQSDALDDDELFEDFRLRLAKSATGKVNRFNLKRYTELDDFKTTLDLRTIRNVVVKQAHPADGSAVFEIFSRLNTGGVNLAQQEIRASLYHSQLMSEMLDLNSYAPWRKVLGIEQPDTHMRDSEIILRSLALARNLDSYKGSMAAFVNQFCVDAQRFSSEQVDSAIQDFKTFLSVAGKVDADSFRRLSKFSGVLFESFFAAWARNGRPRLQHNALSRAIKTVRDDPRFANTLQEGSTKPDKVRSRVNLATEQLNMAAS
ncbi:DUF262 domain-containing protein [Micromonospora avicenniae]|uniref:DUF262 domain-containing protein n=1 Tax=Micromonospora avicenniae TaxID=1198245 RepID=UPI0033315537